MSFKWIQLNIKGWLTLSDLKLSKAPVRGLTQENLVPFGTYFLKNITEKWRTKFHPVISEDSNRALQSSWNLLHVLFIWKFGVRIGKRWWSEYFRWRAIELRQLQRPTDEWPLSEDLYKCPVRKAIPSEKAADEFKQLRRTDLLLL